MTDTVENLKTATTNLKTSVDQKSNKILNKTTAVLEKVKDHESHMKLYNTKQSIEGAEGSTHVEPGAKVKKKTHASKRQSNKNVAKTNTEPGIESNVPQKQRQNPKQSQRWQQHNRSETHEHENSDLIDLTIKPKTVIKHVTLIKGSFILKNVKINNLNEKTTVRTIPETTVEKLKFRLDSLDIDKCKNLILHVGGNDAANGEDLHDFRDSYECLIDSVYVDDRNVIISELLPRDDADVKPYYEVLRSLCEDNAVEFVENFDSFLLASGEMPESY